MQKAISLIFLLMFFIPVLSSAETLLLKSKEIIEGKIVEKTDKSVKIDVEGMTLTYYLEDIESIDGKKLVFPLDEIQAQNNDKKEIVVYLRSGEIIKGRYLAEKNDSLAIDKNGNILIFKNEDIEKTETAEDFQNTGNTVDVALPVSKPDFTTAVIKYDISGSSTGYKTTFIDMKRGKISEEMVVTKTFPGMMSRRQHIRNVFDGKTVYSIDFEKNLGLKIEKKADIILDTYNEPSYYKYPVEKAKKTVAGKECMVYVTSYGKTYFWQGIILKEVIEPGNGQLNSVTEAVSVTLNEAIPDEIFSLPRDIEFTTPEEMTKKWSQAVTEMQKKLKEKKGCPLATAP